MARIFPGILAIFYPGAGVYICLMNNPLITRIRNAANPSTMMGQAIIMAIDAGVPAAEVISMVSSQAADEPEVMITVLGADIVDALVPANRKAVNPVKL